MAEVDRGHCPGAACGGAGHPHHQRIDRTTIFKVQPPHLGSLFIGGRRRLSVRVSIPSPSGPSFNLLRNKDGQQKRGGDKHDLDQVGRDCCSSGDCDSAGHPHFQRITPTKPESFNPLPQGFTSPPLALTDPSDRLRLLFPHERKHSIFKVAHVDLFVGDRRLDPRGRHLGFLHCVE